MEALIKQLKPVVRKFYDDNRELLTTLGYVVN